VFTYHSLQVHVKLERKFAELPLMVIGAFLGNLDGCNVFPYSDRKFWKNAIVILYIYSSSSLRGSQSGMSLTAMVLWASDYAKTLSIAQQTARDR
jgi:hypothetical protein